MLVPCGRGLLRTVFNNCQRPFCSALGMRSVVAVAKRRLAPAMKRRLSVTPSGSSGDNSGTRLKIGGVSVDVGKPKRPELVPCGYAHENPPQSTLHHLKWLLQKDLLKQDVFLIGVPGSVRRNLVMQYLEMSNREYEYLSLTRDTTEADIKQRREIRGGTAYYVDLCAVRAALNGRVLILDGVEKAERNVLPILNNLLENREMQLDDGRFLVAPEKYDKLLKEHTSEELESWQLVRVSKDFHVVALGLPVPKFRGHTLDPPLRSRFQSRHVTSMGFQENLMLLRALASNISSDRLSHLLSFVYGLAAEESASVGLPQFPVDNLPVAAVIWHLNPHYSAEDVIRFLYPYKTMLKQEGQEQVENFLDEFGVKDDKNRQLPSVLVASIDSTSASKDASGNSTKDSSGDSSGMEAKVAWDGQSFNLKLVAGRGTPRSLSDANSFVPTKSHNKFLADMLVSHAVGDFCIIGPKGSGKTTLVQRFSQLLGYETATIMLYQDMTSRELLQQRRMLPSGDTIWQESVLVEAARAGKLAVLDGLHRVHHSALNVLQRLVHNRELELFDGTRLIGMSRFEALMKRTGMDITELAKRNIFPIHPSFRLIGLAEPPNLQDSSQHWLTPELLTLFVYHELRPLPAGEETAVITDLVPGVSEPIERGLVEFVETLRRSQDTNLRALADSLSTRQLLRIMRRLTAYPQESLYSCIHKACLSRFLPQLTKTTLDEALQRAGIAAPEQPLSSKNKPALRCENVDGTVYIGETTAKAHIPVNRTMVPDILFYENEQHVRVMEDMLRDFKLGEHLLLIGNQGVGKNKIADRFLQLLDRPRQYIQLHRDTTVQTLTLQSTVINGVLVYEDSPLVKAVKHGHVLVIDEGDKAPTHVTCVLKSLVESGEMHLADGRRIVPSDYASDLLSSDKNLIRVHPDFRVIVLANRPGFPFLGNDFFGALGDLFACHAVDNPSTESELEMLRRYGPEVPEQTLKKLVAAFGELRSLADQGLLNYPYSTRELVNIVRHVQKFPTDGLTTVVGNVFDFDAFSSDAAETLVTVLRKHGIPIGIQKASDQIRLAATFPMAPFKPIGEWGVRNEEEPKIVDTRAVRLTSVMKGPHRYNPARFDVSRLDMRSETFSEQEASWQLPTHEANICCDAAYVQGRICVASVNPVALYVLEKISESRAFVIDLTAMFPTTRGSFKPRVKLASLGERGVALHEEMTNSLMLFDLDGLMWSTVDVSGDGLLQSGVNKIAKIVSASASVNSSLTHWRMATSHVTDEGTDVICLFERNGSGIKIVDLVNDSLVSYQLPNDVKLLHCWMVGKEKLLLSTANDYKLMTLGEKALLRSVDSTGEIPLISTCGSKLVTGEQGTQILPAIIGENVEAPGRLMAGGDYLSVMAVGFPETFSTSSLYAVRRPTDAPIETKRPYWASEASLKFVHPDSTVALVNDPPQTIRALPAWKTPAKILTKDTNLTHTGGFLEVSDVLNMQTSYIPVPAAKFPSYNTGWLCSVMEAQFVVAPTANGVITVDSSGGVRVWETTSRQVSASLSAWKKMFGADDEQLRAEYDRSESDADLSKLDEPKVGKFDPTNAPHVGGNTWAGGTGGYNTAGLGGVGGPFRLDSGNDVYQMPESVKAQVPDHIRQKAREMAKRAYKQRLREIDMSEYDADAYEKFFKKVAKQSALLKVIIESLQAKGKERQWVRHQTSGDLDDGKLIEGLTGEKSIYRRRTEKEPEPGTPMQKPKRMRICADVSGSMYRFNGYDQRLQKTLEACLMVMDSLDTHADKIKYDIVGHSGEEPDASFVRHDRPPKNEKERLDVLKKMLAHAQFCVSGDHTLEATKLAVEQLAKEDADERFVIVLSDANFERYGIRPKDFSRLMTLDDRVNVFAIFIGSLGEQAALLKRALPAGKAFVCKDTAEIPQIMQLIFTSTVLGSGGSAQD